MDFKMRKYETCRQCHNIKQCDDFVVMEVQPDKVLMENRCYTCGFTESCLYEKIAIEIPKEGNNHE